MAISIGPAPRTRIAANGSAVRVMSEPKIEIVPASPEPDEVAVAPDRGLGTGVAGHRVIVARRPVLCAAAPSRPNGPWGRSEPDALHFGRLGAPEPARHPERPYRAAPPSRTEPPDRMFDTLSERLRKTLGDLTGRGRISEADVDAAMREIRLSLLEADVNFKVVKDFIARVRERAVGADILYEPDRRPAGRRRSSTRSSSRSCRAVTGRSTSRATRRSCSWPGSRARARRRPPRSSPATSSSSAGARCSSRPTRTDRTRSTSSRPSARASASRSIAHPPAPRWSTSPAAASRRPAARSATPSSSTPPAG